MDNKTFFMVVVAIVLGMLVSNMFKEVCGCKNLIEGQCTGPPVGDQVCMWVGDPNNNPDCPFNRLESVFNQPIEDPCTAQTTAAETVPLPGDNNLSITDLRGAATASSWDQSNCCAYRDATQTVAGSPVTISPDGCITGGGVGGVGRGQETTGSEEVGCQGLILNEEGALVADSLTPVCENPIFKTSLSADTGWTIFPPDGSGGLREDSSANLPLSSQGTAERTCQEVEVIRPMECLQCMDAGNNFNSLTDLQQPYFGTFCRDCCTENPNSYTTVQDFTSKNYIADSNTYQCQTFQYDGRPSFSDATAWNRVTCENTCGGYPDGYSQIPRHLNEWCTGCCNPPRADQDAGDRG